MVIRPIIYNPKSDKFTENVSKIDLIGFLIKFRG